MFGLYRLFLALLVALSHFGLTIHGFNPGQWAVICFYVLSGFLMERQFHKFIPLGGIRSFYLDRLLRIYPVYFVVTILCAIAEPVNLRDTIINFTLLPMNYSTFTNIPILVGPAWSLACEVHFYLLVPFLSVLSTRAIRTLLVLSLVLFALSEFLPESTFWTFTGLPGILFTFLSGMLINRREWSVLRLIYGIVAVLWMIFMSTKIFSIGLPTGININVCIGYLTAIPATAFLCQFSPKVAWDQFLGLFSYPLFLVHMLVLSLCTAHWPRLNIWTYVGFAFLAAGGLVVLVERPFDALRYRVRKPNPSSHP
ncbi:MAG: acyltransferase [Verrucomicrobia bacterium]|nr:acyltransferase [Verrucomicrobiota bacterium]